MPDDPATTCAEIKSEAAQLLSRLPSPPHTKAVLAALTEHTAALAIMERCPCCHSALAVAALGDSAWSVSCPRGCSHDTLRGL